MVACQACQWTVGFFGRAATGSLVSPTTSSPRASRASQSAEPISPDAPVTRTRMRRGMLARHDRLDRRRLELADDEHPALMRLQGPLGRGRREGREGVGRARGYLVEDLPVAVGVRVCAGHDGPRLVAAAPTLEGRPESEVNLRSAHAAVLWRG